MNPLQSYKNLSRKSVLLNKDSVKKFSVALDNSDADIVIAGQLLQRFSNGAVKKHVVFEHVDGYILPKMFPPPSEPPPFIKQRWNPFLGYCLAREDIISRIPKSIQTKPEELLTFAMQSNMRVQIEKDAIAEEIPTFSLHDVASPKKIITNNQFMRNFAVLANILRNNIQSVLCEGPSKNKYHRKIEDIKNKKEIVVRISFGGLGDCLAYTSLPRLLKEQYDVDFYLSMDTKNIFRDPDIEKLCFQMNPFFKGYKESDNIFEFKSFVGERSLYSILTDNGGATAISQLEQQFKLKGNGLPEIYYKPNTLSGYKHTLLCDANWFSGEKWGLYNDPKILPTILKKWTSIDPQNKIEYCLPTQQNLFEYIDKIHSATKFVTFFSGGNSLAVSLKKDATVIVPENLEGNSISLFFFKQSKITYTRILSLASYY